MKISPNPSSVGMYSEIIQYIEKVDPQLAEALHQLGANLMLSEKKGRLGTTFLMPTGELRNKIIKLVSSDKIADADLASDLLGTLIIKDLFRSANEWITKRDDIPNSCHPSQRTEVTEARGNVIHFTSGATAIMDTNFSNNCRKPTLAVWTLTGALPVTTDKPAQGKYYHSNRGNAPKSGGYLVDDLAAQNFRFKIAIVVEHEYLHCESQRRTSNSTAVNCGYLKYVCSLVNYIKRAAPEMLCCIMPLVCFENSDFYILVEPHKTGSYLLSDDIIRGWWAEKNLDCDVGLTRKLRAEVMANTKCDCMFYGDRSKMVSCIDSCRKDLLADCTSSNPRRMVDKVRAAYKQLEDSNQIGGCKLFPDQLAQHYRSNPGLKLVHDELRFTLHQVFHKLEKEPRFDVGQFNELINMVGDYLHADNESERRSISRVFGESIKSAILPDNKMKMVCCFLESTFFVCCACEASENKVCKDVYDVHLAVENKHARLITDAQSAVTDILKELNWAGLPEEMKQFIMSQMGK